MELSVVAHHLHPVSSPLGCYQFSTFRAQAAILSFPSPVYSSTWVNGP